MTEPPLRVGVAGLGYWGPNLARNFAALPDCELVWCCDESAAMRARMTAMFPGPRGDEIYYIYGNRLNLGQLRADENALWSLGAHDVSVVLSLAGEEPIEMVAHGEAYVRAGVEDVVFCVLRFPSGLAAHLHLSWLDPHKERRFTVVGSRRMATFDDMDLERTLTIYDKGFDEDARTYGGYITRSGDVFSPRIANVEPLRVECEHFVRCALTGEQPRSDGHSGLRVVRVLKALQQSLQASRRIGGRVHAG
ncbi:MAG: Gfo/Idh/MocA family protein [Solirubrobacteraceae bacterium]